MFVYNLNTMKTHNEERNAAKNSDTHLFHRFFVLLSVGMAYHYFYQQLIKIITVKIRVNKVNAALRERFYI